MFPSRSSHRRSRIATPVVLTLTLLLIVSGLFATSGAQDFSARSTPTPTPSTIDDIAPNPTEEPDDEIDDFAPNPTEAPTEAIDDLAPNPTEVPPIDDEAIPTTGTVRVIKKDCPAGVPDDAFLSDYLTICTSPHDGVEFVVNDVNGAQAGVTANGMVEWTGVDPGAFNITETIPAGYLDPIVFCGYTESPGGGVQHPALMDATGGIVEGTFPDTMFEFVCYWMNVKAGGQILPGADDIAIAEQDRQAEFLLMKHVCPNDISPGQDPAYYLEQCAGTVDGIEFTLTHGNGSSTKPVSGGEATWSGIPIGPFTVDEDIPVQFGEPIVFCGWTAIYEGVVYDAFAQPAPSSGGTVELEVSIPGAFHFCYFFNVKGVDDLADPGARANTLVTRKWDCPDGTLSNQPERDYYFERCQLMTDPVEFTLASANGEDTKATAGGFVEWLDVPLGKFTLTEAIPSGYGAPTVFCGWYAYYGGYHYDAFPQLVILAAANVIDGKITIPNTDYFCDVFNIEGEVDDFRANPTEVPAIDDFQGNPTAGTVRLEKRDCPPGVPADAILSEYLRICTQLHDGIEFSLETTEGIVTGTTAMGQVGWTGVPGGAFEIQETIPAGYGDPIVFCGYTESPGGGVQHPSQQSATGGVVTGTLPENAIFEFVCYWMNVKESGQGLTGADDIANPGGGDRSTLTVRKHACPFGMGPSYNSSDLARMCATSLDGVAITVTHGNGQSTKPIIDGEATWLGLPFGPIAVDEAVPGGYGDPIAVCETTLFDADGSWALSTINVFTPASGGSFELDFSPPTDLDLPDVLNAQSICLIYNMPLGPGSFEQPQETSNSLSVRKWICPGIVEATDNQAYLESQCELSTFPVDITLTNADGASTQATDPGWTTWEDVPLGEFTLQETVPGGYIEPIVFCNWTAFHDGMIYDAFPHLVPSTGGLVEGEITIPNTTYHCDLFNITTLHTITVYTQTCPEGVVPTDSYWSGNDECSALDGVDVQLTTDSGSQEGVTTGPIAWMEWSYVDLGPSGTIQIGQNTPDGYGEPVVWCVSFPVIAGDAQDFIFFPATAENGVVTVQPEQHFPYRFSCHFFNIPDGAGFGGPGSFTANQAGAYR